MMKRTNQPRIRVRRGRKTNNDEEKKLTEDKSKEGKKDKDDEEKKATEDKSKEGKKDKR